MSYGKLCFCFLVGAMWLMAPHANSLWREYCFCPNFTGARATKTPNLWLSEQMTYGRTDCVTHGVHAGVRNAVRIRAP
ncbi:hypothetical protein BDR07DRAFT_1418226 [Suillus spraguei]|nr:hypothetical protein BDR07DRAFT_1438594 [Suillus spraguei]KAG2358213.1 hypothetical protein BDR07DRAFT_1418226 [Suillus spraguei]